ncbi:unnamed protein product [Sphagnum balticum]
MTALVEEIKKLKKQVDAADKRINKAWDDWDAEAYEGACETRERFYAKLQNLRRKTVKPLAQPRIVLAPVRLPWHRRINWWGNWRMRNERTTQSNRRVTVSPSCSL